MAESQGRGRLVLVGIALLAILLGTLYAWMRPADEPAPRRAALPPAEGPIGIALDPDAIPTGDPVARQQKLDEMAAFLEASAAVTLICPVSPAMESGRAIVIDEDSGEVVGDGAIVLGQAYLVMSAPFGVGTFRVEGHEPKRFAWSGAVPGRSEAKCKPSPVPLAPGVAAVVGVVRDSVGKAVPDAMVEGCTGRATSDEEGGYYLEAKPGRCEVRAYRVAGERIATSAPVEIEPKLDAEIVADLTLSADRPGGLGAAVGDAELGIEILSLVGGSIAEEAGLEPGDLVTSIDGQLTEGMTKEEFLRVIGGDGGTAYMVVHAEDGAEKKVEIDRRLLRGP